MSGTRCLPKDTKRASVPQRGKVSGWLRKKTCRFGMPRYVQQSLFTVDFEARMLHYGQSGRLMSMPFCDVLGVEPLISGAEVPCLSGLLCLPQFQTDPIATEDQHDFVLHTKARRMELRCKSAAERQKWIVTIQDAITQNVTFVTKGGTNWVCDDEVDCGGSTRTCSRNSTSSADEWEVDSDSHCDDFPYLTMPLRKVPLSNVGEPGRCFLGISAADASTPGLPRSRAMCSHAWKQLQKLTPDVPSVMHEDSTPRDEEVNAGKTPYALATLSFRELLLARGKKPPRNIRIP